VKLLTKAIEKKLPALYATDGKPDAEKRIVVKFFGGGSARWYVIEGSREGDDVMFFGYVTGLGPPGCDELGYFSLSELESVKFPPFGLGIERDMYWDDKATLADVKAGKAV
jgi:hypothetical protein